MARNQGGMVVEPVELSGGLDLVSPALDLAPGACIDCSNYEPNINGGYRRIFGIERFDGHQAPSTGNYWNMACSLTGAVAVGNAVTGATSGATAYVLQVNGSTELIVCVISGTFQAESITVAGAPVGTITTVNQNNAQTPQLHASYQSLAANYYRSFIQKVPGSGPVRGVWYLNGSYYAFRDNVGATAGAMFVASPGISSAVTISIAAPGVVAWANHGLIPGQAVTFSTTGALPIGLVAGTTYYVANSGISANSFSVSATFGGAAITTSGTQSGTQTCIAAAGWQQVSMGVTLAFQQWAGTVTISIASPGVVTWANHGLSNGQQVSFSVSAGGALPSGLTASTIYYVVAAAAGTFEVAATLGGTPINTTGSASGTITCTAVGTQISAGQTVTGAVSGATGIVQRSLLRIGTWSTAPIGSLVFDSITGAFQSGEALIVSGVACVGSSGASASIALTPGGRYVFTNYNFSGGSSTYYMYGTDGKNQCFEFDGVRYIPIPSGLSPDAPTFIAAWKNMLVMAVGSSFQVSGIGAPYSYTALTGAAEFGVGAPITGLLPQISSQTEGTLCIFTLHNLYILYGNSVLDFNLVLTSPDSGSYPYGSQNIGFAYYVDTKGVQQMNTSRNFGNFVMSTLTRLVQPLIDLKRGMLTATCIVRNSNQMRLYFSDGTGLIVYMQTKEAESIGGTILLGDELGGLMPLDYSAMGAGWYLNTVESIVDTGGIEQVIGAGSDGYVYFLQNGTSFDGSSILSYLFMAFNNSRTPRNFKHYKRATIEVRVTGTADVTVGYDLSYGDTSTDDGYRNAETLIGGGGNWDKFSWDNFNWDSPIVSEYTLDMPGDGRNIGMLIYGDTAKNLPYTLNNLIFQYSVRRQARG